MTFWVLFGIVVVSFTLTFYWNYEKIYSQKLLEIDRDVNKIGTQIDRNIVSYERLLKTEEYKLLTLTEDNLRVLESLNDEARHQLMKDGGFVESDDLFESASLSAINSMNDILQKNRELYVDDHRVLDFQIVPIFDQGYSDVMSNNYPEGTETIKVGDALYLVNDKFADKRNWTIYKLIESQGILFGYIKLSVVSIGPGTYGINSDQIVEMIYYIGNNQYIDEELPTKLSSRIKESNFEEASQLLKDNGYYTNRYISSKNNIKMIYYVANKDLRKAKIGRAHV